MNAATTQATPSLWAYPAIGATTAIVTRLLQRYLPTKLEEAHTAQLIEQTAMLRDQFRKNRDLQLELAARASQDSRDLADHRLLLGHFPLDGSPNAFLEASRLRQGRTLNVIAKLSRGLWPAAEKDARDALLSALDRALPSVGALSKVHFDDEVFFCYDMLKPTMAHQQQLAVLFHAFLKSEPTALIEISLWTPRTIAFDVSVWGWGWDQEVPKTGTTLYLDIAADDASMDKSIATALLGFTASLNDAYQATIQLDRLPAAKAFGVLRTTKTIELRSHQFSDEHQPLMPLTELVLFSHLANLERIAERAPAAAAELAAKSAREAHRAGDRQLAGQLLEFAIRHASGSNRALAYNTLARSMGSWENTSCGLVDAVTREIHGHIYDRGDGPEPNLADWARRAAAGLHRRGNECG